MLSQGMTESSVGALRALAMDGPTSRPVPAEACHLDLLGTTLDYRPNAEIYPEEAPTRFIYEVQKGAVRTSKLLSDGRRQVCSFHFPGGIFGLEAGQLHRFSAEAVSASAIRVLDRRMVMTASERDGDLRARLLSMTVRELGHAHDHMLLLGRKSATERVVAFLLEMAARQRRGAVIDLPMSRCDIADYLGLTVETISRTLSELEGAGSISRSTSRRIILRDRAALERLEI